MDSTPFDIDMMSRSIRLLRYMSYENQNDDYKSIINMINKYLLTYCHHDICTDEIDINIDQTKTIKYCEKCGLTFD